MQHTKVVNTKGTRTPWIKPDCHIVPKESREDKETQSPHKGSQGETAPYRVPTELTGQEETEVGPCKAICRTQETVVKTQRGLGRRSKRRVG